MTLRKLIREEIRRVMLTEMFFNYDEFVDLFIHNVNQLKRGAALDPSDLSERERNEIRRCALELLKDSITPSAGQLAKRLGGANFAKLVANYIVKYAGDYDRFERYLQKVYRVNPDDVTDITVAFGENFHPLDKYA